MAITHIHQEVSAKLLKEGKLFPEIFQATMQRIEKQENIVLNIPDILKELESYRLVAVSLPKGSKTENNKKDFYATIHPDVYLSESAYQEGFLFEILYLDRNKNKNHSERGYLKKDNTAKRATISIDVEETWVNPDLMNVDEGSFYDYPEHPKSYLFQELLDRRLVGKNMAFRFAQRPVHLRYDDADSFLQAVNDMIDEGHNKAHFYAPVLFLNTENKEIIQEYAEELASFVAIYIDDPEFHEELEASLPEYSFIQLPDSNCGVIIFPDKVQNVICNIIGLVGIILGVIRIFMYLSVEVQDAIYRNDFVEGIVLILIGILVIYQKTIIQSLIPFIVAIVIIVDGFVKLQDGIDAKRLGYDKSYIYVIFAAISIIVGLIVMFNLVDTGNILFQILGGGLVYCGISDIVSVVFIANRVKKFVETAKKEEEYVEKKANAVDAEFMNNTTENPFSDNPNDIHQ